MAENLYGDEWDSDEFQTALKVVLKCEIQSLLERLSETGEETVLLTASAADLCVGHLASSKALRFVNTADVGLVKNKFLNFLTGAGPQPQVPRQATTVPGTNTTTNKGKVSQVSGVVCNNLAQVASVPQPKPDTCGKTVTPKTPTQNLIKPAEKRPLETGTVSQEFNSQSLDVKRRKTDSQVPAVKGNVLTSLQTVSSTSALVTQAMASNANRGSAPKLRTTKVVSKSGGFTEERFSDAEFQKFLAQYKPGLPQAEEEEDNDISDNEALLRSVSLPHMSQQKPFQPSQVSSVQNTQNKVTSTVNSSTDKNVKVVNQPVKTPNTQKTPTSELKKDSSCAKLDNKIVNKENRENLNTDILTEMDLVTEIKEELDPTDLEFQEASTPVKKDNEQKVSLEKDNAGLGTGSTQKKDACGQAEKTGMSNQNRNRLESIDNLDTETLIQMTKAKHMENMSEADREIQAKLGQLSSKLSWVVEYPKGKGKPEPGQGVSGPRPQVTVAGPMPLMSGQVHHGAFGDNSDDPEIDELDDEDMLDDDDFDEDDLDDEDKAALKAMREAHMRKLAAASMAGFGEEDNMFSEGFGVSQHFHNQQFPEDFEEEEDFEGYDDFNSEDGITVNIGHLGDSRIHGTLPNLSGPGLPLCQGEGSVSSHQPYQRTASPTSENFLMIGPIMAKCLICNKIVRKTEMKPHHESHLTEDPYDDEEEEELEEMEEDDDGGTFHEQQKTLQGEYGQEEGEYPPEEGEYPGEEEGEYSEDYEFQAEDADEGLEFTAEKFVAEKLVAEKMEHVSDSSKQSKATTCDICNKSFKSHANMMRHRKNIHKGETKDTKEDSMNSSCPVCGKSFRHVQKHIKKMHPDYSHGETVSGEVTDSSVDGLKCNICGEQFTEEEKLKEHFKVHA